LSQKTIDAAVGFADETLHPAAFDLEAAHKIASHVAGRDDSRPHIVGVRHEPGLAIATDGHRMITVPSGYSGEPYTATVDNYLEHTENQTFVEWQRVLPENLSGGILLDVVLLRKVIKHTKALMKGSWGPRAKISREEKAVVLETWPLRDPAAHKPVKFRIGDAACECFGTESVGLNLRYLEEALRSAKGLVKFETGKSLAPVSVLHTTGIRHIIMPMRIS